MEVLDAVGGFGSEFCALGLIFRCETRNFRLLASTSDILFASS